MRYKKLSADFRKEIGLQDPNPASLVFDCTDDGVLAPVRERAHKLLDGCGRSFNALSERITNFNEERTA